MIPLIKSLISINSVSGNEHDIAQFIQSWLKPLNLRVYNVDNNIIVHIPGTVRSRALIFNSHTDTVHPGNTDKWVNSPFEPTLKKGKLYGLGASDDKGSVTAQLMTAKHFSSQTPPCDLWFSFVTMEEIDGSGSKKFLAWFEKKGYLKKYQKIAGIVGEPRNLNDISIGHKGNIFVQITTHGETGHSSQTLNNNEHAIYKMLNVLNKLGTQSKKWQKKYKHSLLGAPTISLTGIKSGSLKSPNKYPDKCIAQFDVRTTPSFHKNFDKEITQWLGNRGSYKYASEPAPYGLCNIKETIVQDLIKIVPQARVSISPGSTDQCFFTDKGIPAIIFGPGDQDICHMENEYITLKEIEKCVDIYVSLITSQR